MTVTIQDPKGNEISKIGDHLTVSTFLYHFSSFRPYSIALYMFFLLRMQRLADTSDYCFETGVHSMEIVEKGIWDDFFPLEEGGHVHMTLQFSLSEEERNRIRGVVLNVFSLSHLCVHVMPIFQRTMVLIILF